MNLSKEIGLRIKSYRIDHNLTQTQLAKMLGIVNSTLSKYEAEGISDIDTINNINKILGLNIIDYPIKDSIMKDTIENPFVDFDMKKFEESVEALLNKEHPTIEDWSYLKENGGISKCWHSPYSIFEVNELIKVAQNIKNSNHEDKTIKEHDAKRIFWKNFKNVLLTYAYNCELRNKGYEQQIYIPNDYDYLKNFKWSECAYFSGDTSWAKNMDDDWLNSVISIWTLNRSFEWLNEQIKTINNKEAYFLLRAIYFYLMENDDVPHNCKNIPNVKKLLQSNNIDENSPVSMSPLDLLFDKVKAGHECPKAIEMYNCYKMGTIQDQRQAVLILLYKIERYINDFIEDEYKSYLHVYPYDDVSIYFKSNEIVEKEPNRFVDLHNFLKKDNNNLKNKELDQMLNIIPNFELMENLKRIKAGSRVALKKGEAIIYDHVNKKITDKVDFNFNI